ncbi:MAG: lipocalin-like domain-containing protein [Vicinamibacterales bacterium]
MRISLGLALALAAGVLPLFPAEEPPTTASEQQPWGGAPASGYRLAVPGYRFEFPRDHFDHPEFQTEWWYYTGNLRTAQGRRFGFELTFFRHGVKRSETDRSLHDASEGSAGRARKSPWEIDHVYLAHLALTDVDGRRFLHEERVNRRGPPPGIAGASLDERRTWNGNWFVEWGPGSGSSSASLRLEAVARSFSIRLDLASSKLPVIHGNEGVSQKAEGYGRASHYVSLTRLLASGIVEVDGAAHAVEGTAWMDHEFFTHQLSEEQVGWDWFSVQLDDSTEMMLYRLRRNDGKADPFSAGTYIDRNGSATHLAAADCSLEPVGETWKSAVTGAVYPIRWRLIVPSLGVSLEARALLPDQELTSRNPVVPDYWEGAIALTGEKGGKRASGVGYLEMTGYDRAIALGGRDQGEGVAARGSLLKPER